MVFDLKLQSKTARIGFIALAAICLLLLAKVIITGFVIGTFADRRQPVTRQMLEESLKVFPNSPRLLTRLAEYEAQGDAADLELAEQHISEAIRRSPRDFRQYLVRGEINDARQDQQAAKDAYQSALALAPNFAEAHWRLANVLLREGNQAEAFEHFQRAATLNQRYLPASLDLVWRVSNKNIEAVKRITSGQPAAQVKFALLLADEGQFPEAIEYFSQIEESTAAKSPDTAKLLDKIAGGGYPRAAYELWYQLQETKPAAESQNSGQPWNPGFEFSVDGKGVSQKYNWHLADSNYARVMIDDRARTGSHALRVELAGRETTKLGAEIKQNVVLEPGAKYQVEFFAQTENFFSPEGPKIAVSNEKGEVLGASTAISEEARNWTKYTFDFVAPQTAIGDGVSVTLTLIRKPRYAYDDPTRGTIFFDDFSIKRL